LAYCLGKKSIAGVALLDVANIGIGDIRARPVYRYSYYVYFVLLARNECHYSTKTTLLELLWNTTATLRCATC
jgi:hypothetical protein